MTNPFQDRDLHTILLFPALSWSSYNQFVNYDKEEWYRKYVLGNRTIPNPSMEAGRIIGERLAMDPTYLPEVPRPKEYEVELRADFPYHDYNGLVRVKHVMKLVGHLDGLSLKKTGGKSKCKLLEYKTSLSDKTWTASSVAKHEQLDFYCLLLYLNYKIKPEELDISLVYIPVKQLGSFEIVRSEEPIRIINTQRTLSRILLFAAKLKKVHVEMRAYIDQQEKLSAK